MKIAVIGIRGLPANYGGFETCAEQVARHWRSKGHEVRVYCRRHRYRSRPSRYDGVELRYVPAIPSTSLETLSHSLLSILHLIGTGRAYRYVHLYNTGNGLFLPLLKGFGIKVAISVDGIEWKRTKWGMLARNVHRLGERMAVRFADRIVADNPEVAAYYKERYGIDAAQIGYGAKPIERDPVAEARTLQSHGLEGGRYFLFVGRLVPEKGVHHLIAAYKNLVTDYPLVIIGDDDPNSEYRNALLDERSDRIRFLGYRYGAEYEHLLVNAAMYVSASELEGTSPSLLAAMGAGACSLVNGIPENLQTTAGNAFTYPENDQEALAQRWQAIIDDPAGMRTMAQRGRTHIENNYRWPRIAEQYLEEFAAI